MTSGSWQSRHIWFQNCDRVGQGVQARRRSCHYGKCEMAVRDPQANLPTALRLYLVQEVTFNKCLSSARPWGHGSQLRAMVFPLQELIIYWGRQIGNKASLGYIYKNKPRQSH